MAGALAWKHDIYNGGDNETCFTISRYGIGYNGGSSWRHHNYCGHAIEQPPMHHESSTTETEAGTRKGNQFDNLVRKVLNPEYENFLKSECRSEHNCGFMEGVILLVYGNVFGQGHICVGESSPENARDGVDGYGNWASCMQWA